MTTKYHKNRYLAIVWYDKKSRTVFCVCDSTLSPECWRPFLVFLHAFHHQTTPESTLLPPCHFHRQPQCVPVFLSGIFWTLIANSVLLQVKLCSTSMLSRSLENRKANRPRVNGFPNCSVWPDVVTWDVKRNPRYRICFPFVTVTFLTEWNMTFGNKDKMQRLKNYYFSLFIPSNLFTEIEAWWDITIMCW